MQLNYVQILKTHIIDMKCQKSLQKIIGIVILSIIYFIILGELYPFIKLIMLIVNINFGLLLILLITCFKYNFQLLLLTNNPEKCNVHIHNYMCVYTLKITEQAKKLHYSILYLWWLKHIITETYIRFPSLFNMIKENNKSQNNT